MSVCRACASSDVGPVVRFGRQPLCNRFLRDPKDAEPTFDIRQGVCRRCGVVQLLEGPSAAEIRSRFPWATQLEPERHLDELVANLCKLPSFTFASPIGGITFKDDSTLDRFTQLGYKHVARLDLKADLSIGDPLAGVETIQAKLTEPAAVAIRGRRGAFDLIVVRHILEHAHDLNAFTGALRALLSDRGYAVFEVPDAEKGLTSLDYSGVWEEHIFYFTSVTLPSALAASGFEATALYSFPYAHENSLVAVARKRAAGTAASTLDVRTEIARFERYAQAYLKQKEKIRAALQAFQRAKGKIAAMGAGHLTGMFINLMGVGDLIECVIDDNPHKQGLYMPGSKRPIVSSGRLMENGIKRCLVGINPENEEKILSKNRAFTDAGGEFFSIFPDSRHALPDLKES